MIQLKNINIGFISKIFIEFNKPSIQKQNYLLTMDIVILIVSVLAYASFFCLSHSHVIIQIIILINNYLNSQSFQIPMKSKYPSTLTPHKNKASPHHKYNLHELIGQGQIGKVYKATLIDFPSEIFAIKIIPMSKLKNNPKLKELLKNQIQILCTIEHPNIIKFEEIFCWENKVYMVYEYCEGGSLEDVLPVFEGEATQIFRQILSACEYAEQNAILHRDLKPANILFKNGVVKVADWGFSKLLEGEYSTKSYVGSPAYMAPEVLKCQNYTNKADVWSFGVMMFQCLFNKLPWPATTLKQLKELVTKKLEFPKHINPLDSKIIRLCLEYNPQKRASFKKLLKIISEFQVQSRNSIGVKTSMNPQESSQLNEEQVRMCTYFLQFAQESESFENEEMRGYCLDYILLELQKLRKRRLIETPRTTEFKTIELKSVKTEKKITRKKTERQTPKSQGKVSETFSLLEKQIALIQKIRVGSEILHQMGSKYIKKVIMGLVKKCMNSPSGSQTRIVDRHILVELNLMVNVLMFDRKSSGLMNNSVVQDLWQLKKAKRAQLFELLTAKISYLHAQ